MDSFDIDGFDGLYGKPSNPFVYYYPSAVKVGYFKYGIRVFHV
jgi:hypothetical protein